MTMPTRRKYDRKRPIAQRILLDRADQEIALIIDRFVRGATVESRALAHAAILRALVDASTH